MENLLAVKPFQETLGLGNCGPASLKMVLDYYGVEAGEEELAKLCGTTKELGTNDVGIKKSAEHFGFKVEIKNNSNFSDIQNWLKKKIPVIVNWFTRGRDDYPEEINAADGHYSVVIGLNEKYIYLQDPEIGRTKKLQRDIFKHVWFDFLGEYIKPNELIIRQLIAIYHTT